MSFDTSKIRRSIIGKRRFRTNIGCLWKGTGSRMTSDMSGIERVMPFQGGECLLGTGTQGDALGYRVHAPSVRKTFSPNDIQTTSPSGAQPTNPGQRRGIVACQATSPNGAKPTRPGQRPGIAACQPTNPGQRRGIAARQTTSPNGAQPISPGQRPGNTSTPNSICPERAKPGAPSLNPGRFIRVVAWEEIRPAPELTVEERNQEGANGSAKKH